MILLFYSSCSQKSEYEQMVEEGLNSGQTVDDIFLGYTFDTTREEFYEMSWEMNQQGIITGGVKIEYLLEELKSTARLEFFPEFKDGVVVEMPISAVYVSWAPWNEEYSANNLLMDLKTYYEDVYNTQFNNVLVPDLQLDAWVSIQGNREIRLYEKSVSTIQINFIDLSKVYQN